MLTTAVKWIKTGEDKLMNPTKYELQTVGDRYGERGRTIAYVKKTYGWWSTDLDNERYETSKDAMQSVNDELGILDIPDDQYSGLC